MYNARAFVRYDSLLPQPTFSQDDIFRFVVFALQNGLEVVFDFYKSSASTYLKMIDKDTIRGKTVYTGYGEFCFQFPIQKTEFMVLQYLDMKDFERVSYIDSTDFKNVVARKCQIVVAKGGK